MRTFFGTLAYNFTYNSTLRAFKKMSVAQLVYEVKEKDGDEFFHWVFNASINEEYINEPWHGKLKEYKDTKWTNDIEVEYVDEDLVPLEIAKAYVRYNNKCG